MPFWLMLSISRVVMVRKRDEGAHRSLTLFMQHKIRNKRNKKKVGPLPHIARHKRSSPDRVATLFFSSFGSWFLVWFWQPLVAQPPYSPSSQENKTRSSRSQSPYTPHFLIQESKHIAHKDVRVARFAHYSRPLVQPRHPGLRGQPVGAPRQGRRVH